MYFILIMYLINVNDNIPIPIVNVRFDNIWFYRDIVLEPTICYHLWTTNKLLD